VQRNRADRYDSAAEVAEALRAAHLVFKGQYGRSAGDPTLPAGPIRNALTSARARFVGVRRFAARQRTVLRLAALALGLALLALAYLAGRYHRRPPLTSAPPATVQSPDR
jgi:hypothetical protein